MEATTSRKIPSLLSQQQMGDSLDIIDSKQSLLDSVTENSMDDYALN
jgi:hypothetical protein